MDLWTLYTQGKQTYSQLSSLVGCSIRTIQRRLDKVKIEASPSLAKSVVVMTDTTYWGRGFGVMLFKDTITGIIYTNNMSHSKPYHYTERDLKLLKNVASLYLELCVMGRKDYCKCTQRFQLKCANFISSK